MLFCGRIAEDLNQLYWYLRQMTDVTSKRIRLRYILAIAYVFDELINWSLPNNISGTIALITLAFLVILNRPNRLLLSTYDLGFIFIICLASGIAFASDLGCGAESKGILSLALIFFLVLSMRIFSPSLLVLDKAISRLILFSITILLLLAAAKLSLFQLLYDSSRLSDPYSEPSHVALYLLPVLSYRLLNNIQDPWSWLSIVTAILLAPSTTLLVGVTVLLVAYLISIRLSSQKIIPILAVAALSILLVATNKWDTSHHIDRISGITQANNSSVTNNSSLIWLNGWSQAYETFVATYGMGTGFNQMGCGRFAYVGEFSYQLLIGSGTILNTENGSFTAEKIIFLK